MRNSLKLEVLCILCTVCTCTTAYSALSAPCEVRVAGNESHVHQGYKVQHLQEMKRSIAESEHMEPSPMSVTAHQGRPILEQTNLEPQQRKYWGNYDSTTFFHGG